LPSCHSDHQHAVLLVTAQVPIHPYTLPLLIINRLTSCYSPDGTVVL